MLGVTPTPPGEGLFAFKNLFPRRRRDPQPVEKRPPR